jgi:hypothetical protein
MSIRAYSKRRGVTPAATRKAIKSGRISTVNGKIDPEIADRDWAANTDETKPRNSVSGNPALRRPPEAPPVPASGMGSPRENWGGSQTPTRGGGYAAARAVRESYDARIRELEFKRMSSTLVSVDEVRVAAFNTNRRARDLLLAIPDRVSAVVAGMTDAAEIHKVLSDEIRRVCDELSQPLPFTNDDPTQRH